MSKKLTIFIPQLGVRLLRLAIATNISGRLKRDPVALAVWYAAIGEVLEWPEEVASIQNNERAKRLSLDRMMKLLSQVNFASPGRTSAEHARGVLEGYAVHHWVASHHAQFVELVSPVYQRLKKWGEIEIELESEETCSRRGYRHWVESWGYRDWNTTSSALLLWRAPRMSW